jgi:hypothetical protein
MIKIDGLTVQQKELCDIIWNLPDAESLNNWVSSLPRSELPMAWAMINMIIYETLDQDPITDFAEADEVIGYVRSL